MLKKLFKNTNLFTEITKLFVIILPFYVILKVFFEFKLGINHFWIFIKEFLILILFFLLIYEYYKKGCFPKFDILDYLIFWYIWYWLFITLINNLEIKAFIYGWGYDFIFFIVFLIFRHSKPFLKIKVKDLFTIFIYSASIVLFLSLTIKLIWEEFLRLFGFNYYVSNWTFNWSVPIYHWVENSWLRRFQWIFDWPNQMAFFLIIYLWVIFHLWRKKLEFYHSLIFIFIFILLLSTYSRSALLWFFWGILLLIILNIKILFKKYKKFIIYIVPIILFIIIIFFSIFQRHIYNIIMRPASTSWHIERMTTWIKLFLDKPMWHWLASSWPAYRKVFSNNITKQEEKNFIPESWFIQQLVEWWIIYFSLFCSIIVTILFKIYKKNKYLFTAFIAIIIMNLFLHIFEATYLSILFFIFLWLISKNKLTYNT